MSCKSLRVDAGVLTGLVMAGAVIWMVLASAPRSHAIPAFSRKYQTSCTTCHNNYPELNDFGEAFKKNGFKFPKDDDVFVKQDPVLLGSKAQKEAFLEAVYPGEIPGTLPIAFRYSGNFNWNAKQPSGVNQTSSYLPRTDLFVPNTFTIISAGSFGQNLSFWIDDDISTGGSGGNGGLGDGYLKYNDLSRIFHLPKDSLNVRFGQFELDLPFTQARTIYLSDYDVYDQVNVAGVNGTTNNPFTLGAPQRAIEFSGYPNDGNFSWSVAITNGNNDGPAIRNSKDVYIRVSQKFNLESDPESRHAIQAAGPTGPRDHTSIRIGGFFYHGTNVQNIGATPPPYPVGSFDESFYRAGADVRFKYRHLELFGLGMVGHDDNHVAVETDPATLAKAPAVTYTGGFVGANYWFYPWLIGTMRYDFVNSPTDFANGAFLNRTRNTFSPGFQILVRANVKIVGEYQRRSEIPITDVDGNTVFYRPNTFVTGIDYVF